MMKIIVDIFMVVFMSLSFVRWDNGNFAFHAIMGCACVVFFTAHVFIHRKWIKAVTKSLFAGNLNKSPRGLIGKYIINMLLLAVWGASIITGFIAIVPFFSEASGIFAFAWGRIHGITARIGLALVVIHGIQHLPQIISYFRIGRRAKN